MRFFKKKEENIFDLFEDNKQGITNREDKTNFVNII